MSLEMPVNITKDIDLPLLFDQIGKILDGINGRMNPW